WSIGPGFLIMLSAMESVSNEIYEAARVDGAGPLARFIYITLPMISPAIFFTLVVNLTGAFGGALLLDRGYILSFSLSPMEGYINDEMFLQSDLGYASALAWPRSLCKGYINDVMFLQSDLGYASALAWVTFAVMMTITVILFRSARN